MTRDEIIHAIHKERDRQDEMHPLWRGDDHGLTVLVEEFGEVAKALYELNEFKNRLVLGPYDHHRSAELKESLESELVQVAAVCVRWLENR